MCLRPGFGACTFGGLHRLLITNSLYKGTRFMSTNGLYELRCRECGKTWGNVPRSFCEDCFSPLEVAFDYDSLKKIARRENVAGRDRSEEHTSELQSHSDLVCRLLLEKKNMRHRLRNKAHE